MKGIQDLQLKEKPQEVADEKKNTVSYRARKVKTINNAHQDDVHALIKLSDRTFISGSKDGCLRKWDFTGKLVKRVYENARINYRSWITALTSLTDTWLSGTRDGFVHQWNVKGDLIKQLTVGPFFEGEHQCKDRNLNRVNSLSALPNSDMAGNQLFFAGWPTQFTTHNLEKNKRVRYTVTDSNDWVYAVQPVSLTALLVITGPRLDLWERASTSNTLAYLSLMVL